MCKTSSNCCSLDTDFTSSESPCRLPSAEHVQYTYLACTCSCWSIVRRKHRTRSPFLAPTRHALGRGVAIFTSASRYFTPGTCTHGTIAERQQRSACSPTPAASTYPSIAPSEERPISWGSFSFVLRHSTGSVQVSQASLENHTFDRHTLLKHNLRLHAVTREICRQNTDECDCHDHQPLNTLAAMEPSANAST